MVRVTFKDGQAAEYPAGSRVDYVLSDAIILDPDNTAIAVLAKDDVAEIQMEETQ